MGTATRRSRSPSRSSSTATAAPRSGAAARGGGARETRQGRRAGFYAMTVIDEADGTVVATCQAVSLRMDAHRPR